MGVLGEILARLVVAILQWGAARADFRAKVVAEGERIGFDLARKAEDWKREAAARPDGGTGGLRVRPGAELQGFTPDPPPDADGRDVPPGGR